MGHEIIRTLLALLCLMCTETAAAVDLVLNQDYVRDSDGARQYAYAVSMDKHFGRSRQAESVGLRVGGWTRHESGASENFTTLGLNYDAGDNRHLRPRLGLLQFIGSWSPLLGNALVSYDGWDRWYLEASTQREIVESIPAIAERDISQTWSGSADYKLTPAFTAVAGLLAMNISDDNHRRGEIGRLIYSPTSVEGFNLQLLVKSINSDFKSAAYFSPLKLREYELFAGYRKSVTPDWVVKAKLGGGTQRVDGDSRELLEAELSIHGWFTQSLGLKGKLSCANSGGFAVGQGENGYLYCDANIALIGVW